MSNNRPIAILLFSTEHCIAPAHPNRWHNPSYMRKINALLGMALATVIPQPAYNPRTPLLPHISLAVPTKLGLSPPARGPRSSASVCIALFTVSAGKSATLYATPAHAPAVALSHGRSSRLSASESPRRCKSNADAPSFAANHAAPPPVSRMSVPVCPSQSPRSPVSRTTEVRTAMGPGSLAIEGAGGLCAESVAAAEMAAAEVMDGVMSIWTCILHFTSSIGVLSRDKYKDGRYTTMHK